MPLFITALLRVDIVSIVAIALLVLADVYTISTGRHSINAASVHVNTWLTYEKRINTLSEVGFQGFKRKGVFTITKEPGVLTNCFYKIDYLLGNSSKKLERVLELGGGTCGFTQWLIQRRDCLKVDTLCLDREGHGRHRVGELNLPGAAKNTLLFGDVHDFMLNDWYDTVISDIGESHADPLKQQNYSRNKRENFLRIIEGMDKPKILYKELCPWDPQLAVFMRTHGLHAIRVPYTNNTSSEIYLTNAVEGMSWEDLQSYAYVLLGKFDGRKRGNA